MGNAWKVTVWGARGSMPVASSEFLGYGGNTACISVERGEGGIVVFDAGSGLARLGESLAEGPEESLADGKKEPEGSKGRGAGPMDRGREKRVHILLSHLHLDHIIGLFGFRLFHDPDAQIHIYGQGSGGSLQRQLEHLFVLPYWPLGLEDMRADVRIHEVSPGESFFLAENTERLGRVGETKEAGCVRIHTLPGKHPGGSLLYRLEEGDKSLVHALDCEPDRELGEELAAFARNSSLLIWDGTFTKEELLRRKGWGHSSWEQGIGMRRAAGAALVLITHHAPEHTDRFLQEQEEQARAEDEACCFAREGMVLWIGSGQPGPSCVQDTVLDAVSHQGRRGEGDRGRAVEEG